MNPYTSMWTGVTPGDGPQEFHLVLLDNGRTGVLADERGRPALHCIRCSACLNVCPVYERTGGHAYGSVYPGPDRGGPVPAADRGRGQRLACRTRPRLCGACFDACPVRIDIPTMLVHLRGRHVEERPALAGTFAPEAVIMAAAAWTMVSPRRYGLALRLSRVGRLLGRKRGRIGSLPPPCSAWTVSRDLPVPPPETFREWWLRTRSAASHGEGPMSARDDIILARIGAALVDQPATGSRLDIPATTAAPGTPRRDRRRGCSRCWSIAWWTTRPRCTGPPWPDLPGILDTVLAAAGRLVVPDGLPEPLATVAARYDATVDSGFTGPNWSTTTRC